MPRDLRLSPKHGVNPSLDQCFFCGEAKGIVLCGLLPEDKEAPRMMCLNQEPCDACAEEMRTGVMLIEVDEAKSPDLQNPSRTGLRAVVKEELMRVVVDDPTLLDAILSKRMAFLPIEAWTKLGLPREPVDNTKEIKHVEQDT
jgi:hypothetical protein